MLCRMPIRSGNHCSESLTKKSNAAEGFRFRYIAFYFYGFFIF
ncbi:hypothetical protein HMPREF1987_02343 [Peptostreptococcaceae bacterium oral taxon 113 str. W5053]|nr:hypothetical protein HMPREF1987_02343 [Peptostreptococcaceae bacterium oral taxon 113 str. W5053]